ncbi:MAG: peptidylprolyl isomerase, partial [bacterium]
VFSAPLGEVVGPVQTKFGIHIILVEDRKVENGEEQAKARHILLKFQPSADTQEAVYSQASTFAQDAQKHGFFAMAQAYNYPVDTTQFFSEAGYITGLGRMRMAAQFCFNNPVGKVSDVYPYPEGFVVFQIVEAQEELIEPLDKATDRIKKSLERIVKRNLALAQATEVRALIGSYQDMEELARRRGLRIYVTEDSLKPTGRLPEGLKSDREFLTAAFRLKQGEISEVIQGDNGCYIAYMERKDEPDESSFKANYSVIYSNLVNKNQDGVMMNWVRALRINGTIKDFRYRFYRDF